MGGHHNTTISTSILENVRQGDAGAWEDLVACYTCKVYRWCRLVGVPEQDTVDITQDVLLQTFRVMPDFSRDRSRGESLTAWMYTVTRNRIRDYYRAVHPVLTAELDQLTDDVQSEDSLESCRTYDNSRMQRFCQILDSTQKLVDPKTWNAFWRLAVDGDPVKDISRDIGISEGAVRQAKYRVIQMLSEHRLGVS